MPFVCNTIKFLFISFYSIMIPLIHVIHVIRFSYLPKCVASKTYVFSYEWKPVVIAILFFGQLSIANN